MAAAKPHPVKRYCLARIYDTATQTYVRAIG
jgi:polyhydroxyalkanoate synthesis regulator protein